MREWFALVALWVPARQVRLAAIVTGLITPVYAIASYSFAITRDPTAVDYVYFGPGGASILTGQWHEVYANPVVQAGPLEMLCFGPAYLLGVDGFWGWLAYYFVLLAVLTFGLVLIVLVIIGDAPRRRLFYVALGLAAIGSLSWFVPLAVLTGHPAQIAIPLLWALAARLTQERHFVAVGVVIGLSAGWEIWGMLGVPVILLAVRPNLVKAALGGLATLALLYGPFALTGQFHMFEFGWPVRDGTLVHLLWPELESFPWGLRLAQAALVLIVGGAVALLSRNSMTAPWIVSLAIVVVRLLADPTFYGYYWLAAEVLLLGLLAMLCARALWVPAACTTIVLIALWMYTTKGVVAASVLLVMTIAVAIALAVGRRRSGSLVLRDAL